MVFGALIISQSAPCQGSWKYGDVGFIDDIIRAGIIAAGDNKTDNFFKDFNEHLGLCSDSPIYAAC